MSRDPQLLPAIAPAPGMNHHLFFAVLASAQAARQAVQLRETEKAQHEVEGSMVRAERLHVTILSLGWDAVFSETKYQRACLAAAQVSVPAFELQLDRCLSFLGRRSRHPLVLCGNVPGVDGIRVLHRSLYRALDSVLAGGATVDRLVPSMTPHMTLLYSDATVEEHGVSPVRWVVREFQLLYNLRGSPGPYRILAQWPLL